MDLVVDQVRQLEHVHRAHRNVTVELLARAAVAQRGLAVLEVEPDPLGRVGNDRLDHRRARRGQVVGQRLRVEAQPLALDQQVVVGQRLDRLGQPLTQRVEPTQRGVVVERHLVGQVLGQRDAVQLVVDLAQPNEDLLLGDRGEDRRVEPLAAVLGHVAQVRLENLTHVHPAGHTQRVEDDVDRRPVRGERHVLQGHDLRDHTLVAVPPGHFVAFHDLAPLGDVDAHQLVHAGGQFVARLLAQLAPAANLAHGQLGGLREGVLVAAGVVQAAVLEAAEQPHRDHLALAPVRHAQRDVAHLLGLLAENRDDQLLFRGHLRLTLGRDLADQDVLGADHRADLDDPLLVELVAQLLGDVGDVGGDLLGPELGLARLDLVLLDVDRGEHVVADHPIGHDDRVFVVAAVPRHERDRHVLAQRQAALFRARTVGDRVPGASAVGQLALGLQRDRLALGVARPAYMLAQGDDRHLVHVGALVRPLEGQQPMRLLRSVIAGDRDVLGVQFGDHAVAASAGHRARVDGDARLDTRRDPRRLRPHQRHRLALLVRAHKRTIGVVVLEERDQRGRRGEDLLGRDVNVVDLGRLDPREALALAADNHVVRPPQVVHPRTPIGVPVVRRGDRRQPLPVAQVAGLLVRGQPDHFVARHTVDDPAVRGLEEAKLVEPGED